MASAVFQTIWKRKESKIFLLFAFYPLLYLIGSFFGESNFMQITVEPGHELSYLSFVGMMLMSIDGLVLPALALTYLVRSVFKRELDEHILFLYKDLNRKKVFLAKYVSLVLLVVIYFSLFALVSLGIYYGRVAHMEIGANLFLDQSLSQTFYSLASLLGLVTKMFFVLALVSLLSLYLGSGGTMLAVILLALVMLVLGLVGGPLAMIFPNGYVALSELGGFSLLLAFVGPLALTLCYSVFFGLVGAQKFSRMEF